MSDFQNIQTKLLELPNKGDLSDGYHTYNELYHHRMILFSIICNQNKSMSWKSKLHADGTMLDDFSLSELTHLRVNLHIIIISITGICLTF